MAITLVRSGALLVQVSYIELRKKTYYFRRRIPDDVRKLYPDKDQLFFSLKTRDAKLAAKKAMHLAADQDALWKASRAGHEVTAVETEAAAKAMLEAHGLKPNEAHVWDQIGVEPANFIDTLRMAAGDDNGGIIWDELPPLERKAVSLFYGEKMIPSFSQVRDQHIALGLVPKSKICAKAFQRETGEFLAMFGDLPINAYDRAKANQFVAAKVAKGNKATGIQRNLSYLSPIFRTAIREFEVDMKNPFAEINIPNELTVLEKAREKRLPISLEGIKSIQQACRKMDDERRWIISILSDTGARLGEILYLKLSNIRLDDKVPHLIVTDTEDRSVKTAASIRKVPLLGEALWAAKRAVETAKGEYAFPSYSHTTHSSAASAALNKWMKENGHRGERQTLHSLRHSMRDRCRDAGIPSDVADRLGGWTASSVGESYGAGHSLEVLRDWMAKAVPLRIDPQSEQ